MKTYIKKHFLVFAIITGFISSCTNDFGETNTDPNIVTSPNIKFLMTYAQEKVATSAGSEWVWENLEHLMLYSQYTTSSPYELTTNVNSRYGSFYKDILPNLVEIRRQIEMKSDKSSYQKMVATTYIMQILQGIKVTDMNGSIPYSEAAQGRFGNVISPKYDTQQELFNTWLTELDAAIATLKSTSLPAQLSFDSADVFYNGDFVKWTKLANTLKLRIAARLENQDVNKTKAIFQSVMSDAVGPINSDDAQLTYSSIDYFPLEKSGLVTYRSTRYGSTSIINFLKKVNDPRLPIYFEKNDLVGNFKQVLTDNGSTLPSFIDINDPLIAYQGAPADWSTNQVRADYISTALSVTPTNKYFLISKLNRKFFSPRYSLQTGLTIENLVTNAESCLLVAEFIQKGYAGGVNTKGTAEDWYKLGVASSVKSMNNIATVAQSETAFVGDGTAVINSYLNNSFIKFNGVNDLERIYIQSYLNLYKNPTEGFVFNRRTGYPRNASTYYPRETYNRIIPRRFWTNDPGVENRNNWNVALTEQGFTPISQDPQILNSQKIWYDKTAPAFGVGN